MLNQEAIESIPFHLDLDLNYKYDTSCLIKFSFLPFIRWLVLLLGCICMSSLRFVYDIPSATKQEIENYLSAGQDFESNFSLLFTFYSLPNIILPLFGGFLVDRYGSSFCLLVSTIICFLGQLTFSLGLTFELWNVMFLGRALFGIGGEFSIVALCAVLVKWFGGKELSLSFSLSTSIGYVGSIINDWVSPMIAKDISILGATWFGVIISAVSLSSSAFLYCFVDGYCTEEPLENIKILKDVLITESSSSKHNYGSIKDSEYEQDLEKGAEKVMTTAEIVSDPTETEQEIQDEVISSSCSFKKPFSSKGFSTLFWAVSLIAFLCYGIVIPFNNISSSLLLEKYFFTSAPSDCRLAVADQCTSGYLAIELNPSINSNNEACLMGDNVAPLLPLSLNFTEKLDETWKKDNYVFENLEGRDIDCNDPFWAEGCVANYCASLEKSTELASTVISVPYMATALTLPLFGILIDVIGCRAIMILLSFVLFVLAHLSLAFLHTSPTLTLMCQGIGYALGCASLWPAIPIVIEPELSGMAYGIVTASYNMSLSFVPLLISGLYQLFGNSYIPGVEALFLFLSLCGVFVGIFVNIMDTRNGLKLNKR